MSHFCSNFEEIRREVKVCYRIEFLLSLSELDSCKNLPTEFDSSILRELSDSCGALQLFDSVVQKESYNNAVRQNTENGILGKGSFPGGGGKVGASPSEEVQTRRQNTENGLLGKGSFPRKSECIVGVSATDVSFQPLSRSSAPYRPPHLSKVNLLSLVEIRGTNDGKSFGSTNFSNMEKKANKERRIRDSFELMTKGKKAFQEKRGQREDLDSGIATLSGDFANDLEKCSQSEKIAASSPLALTAVISMPGTPKNWEDTSGKKSEGAGEICLPDEDSLITIEDFIILKDLLSMPERAWSSTEIGSIFPATPAENFRKLTVLDPSSDNRKSEPSRKNSNVDLDAGQLKPHFYQPHANPTRHLFSSHSQNPPGRSELQSLNSAFSYHLPPDLTVSTGAWKNLYDPSVHSSQRQIQPLGGFPITHRTAPSQTNNSLPSFSQPKFWGL